MDYYLVMNQSEATLKQKYIIKVNYQKTLFEQISKKIKRNHSCVVITDLRMIVVSVVLTFETGDETTSEDTSQGDTLLSVGLSGVISFPLSVASLSISFCKMGKLYFINYF